MDLAQARTVGAPDGIGEPSLADGDQDGDLDIANPLFGPMSGNPNDNPTDRWALLRNSGGGRFGGPEIYPAGADILDIAIADLDGLSGYAALNRPTPDDNRAEEVVPVSLDLVPGMFGLVVVEELARQGLVQPVAHIVVQLVAQVKPLCPCVIVCA